MFTYIIIIIRVKNLCEYRTVPYNNADELSKAATNKKIKKLIKY
jgi:hypothetical protein